MEMKTYFATSVQAAMDVARRELGPDAMLVTSRPAPESVRHFGPLEVTFAFEERQPAGMARLETDGQGDAWRQGGVSDTPNYFESMGRVVPVLRREKESKRDSGLDDIRAEISALSKTLGGNRGEVRTAEAASVVVADAKVAPRETRELEDDTETLRQAGFSEEIARRVASEAAGNGGRLKGGILRELAARIPAVAFKAIQPEETRILAFIGPPGRGKTSSMVKVAVRYGIANRIPVKIFAAGAHGVGAAEQVARYAAILGVPFHSVESFESLHLALQGERWRGLVLVDTPGLSPGEGSEMEAAVRFFGRRADIETHLVLRAEARSTDMQYMVSRFAGFHPSRLLFTGMDEACGMGAAVDTLIRSGIGVSFLGTGTQIPEGLEAADAWKLARAACACSWGSGPSEKANALAARAA